MLDRQQIGNLISAIGRIARDRLTVPAAILLMLGLAGADPFKDVVYGKTPIGSAFHVFLANLGVLLDNGLVRLFLVALALFILVQSGRRVTVAEDARAVNATAQAAALTQKDNKTREEIVGKVRRLVDDALRTIQGDTAKILQVSLAIADTVEAGRRLAGAEPHLLHAETQLTMLVSELDQGEITPERRDLLSHLAQSIRRAILEGETILGRAEYLMLGSGPRGSGDYDYFKRTADTLTARAQNLAQMIGTVRAEYERGMAELRALEPERGR